MRNLKKTVFRLKKSIRRIERKQDRILSELLLIKCRSYNKDEYETLLGRLRKAAQQMEKESRIERDALLMSNLKSYRHER